MDNRIKVTLKPHQNFLLKTFMGERSITSPSKALVELLDVLLDAIEFASISSNEDIRSLVLAMLKTFESKQKIKEKSNEAEKAYKKALSKDKFILHTYEGQIPTALIREWINEGTLGHNLYKSHYSRSLDSGEQLPLPGSSEAIREYESTLNEKPWLMLKPI